MVTLRALPLQAALILSFLSACSSTRTPAPSETLAAVASQSTMAIVRYDPVPFLLHRGRQNPLKSAPGLFGVVGAVIESPAPRTDAQQAGAQFISTAQLTDPIARVETRFFAAWQRDFKFTAIPSTHRSKSDSLHNLHDQFDTKYVLDFKTESWAIDPIYSIGPGMPPEIYRATYSARARLVRLYDEEIVWQGWCRYRETDVMTPQLTCSETTGDDHGIAVKAAMETLGDACADNLWTQFSRREAHPDLPPIQ